MKKAIEDPCKLIMVSFKVIMIRTRALGGCVRYIWSEAARMQSFLEMKILRSILRCSTSSSGNSLRQWMILSLMKDKGGMGYSNWRSSWRFIRWLKGHIGCISFIRQFRLRIAICLMLFTLKVLCKRRGQRLN